MMEMLTLQNAQMHQLLMTLSAGAPHHCHHHHQQQQQQQQQQPAAAVRASAADTLCRLLAVRVSQLVIVVGDHSAYIPSSMSLGSPVTKL